MIGETGHVRSVARKCVLSGSERTYVRATNADIATVSQLLRMLPEALCAAAETLSRSGVYEPGRRSWTGVEIGLVTEQPIPSPFPSSIRRRTSLGTPLV